MAADIRSPYFTFLDGVFSYDCQACKAECCKGHGLTLSADEERRLDGHIRPLQVFLEPFPRQGIAVELANFKPGCYFLDEQNGCDLQKRYGYESKPHLCKLFPFNNIRRVQGMMIVSPHTHLCPLAVSSDRSTGAKHEDLLPLVAAESERAGQVSDCLTSDHERVVATEERIVAGSAVFFEAADIGGFLALQQDEMLRGGFAAGNIDVSLTGQWLAEVRRLLPGVFDDLSHDEPEVARVVIATSPTLRAGALFPPRGKPSLVFEIGAISRIAAVVYLLALVARRAGMKRVTYQTVMKIYRDNLGLIWLLVHLDWKLKWSSGAIANLSYFRPHARYRAYLVALRQLQTSRPAQSLGDVLLASLTREDQLTVPAVKQMAHLFCDRLGRDVSADVSLRDRARARLQRWLTNTLSPDVVLDAAFRISSARRRHGSNAK